MSAKRALVCAPAMPEYDRESGSRRLFDHIEFLRAAGWSVSFVTREPASEPRYARLLQQRGIATYTGFDARLEQLIGAGRFDVAVLAFWHVAETVLPIIRRLSPATRVVVDSIDLHCLRNARGLLQNRADQDTPPRLNERFGLEMVRELNVYSSADGVLTVSQKEADWINDFLGEPQLALASPDAEEFPASCVPLAERTGILFLGNFRHVPNVGALEFLCKKIVPLLDPALLAENPLFVVGNHLDDHVAALCRGLPGVRIVGWAPAVEPYLWRARMTVVPLLYGAGTKRKLIQSLLAGTPAVSTSVGVEGLALENDRHVLIADDATAFAEGMRRRLTDAPLWRTLAEQGRARVLSLHGRDTTSTRFHHVIADVLCRPAKRFAVAPSAQPLGADAYRELVQNVCDAAKAVLPSDAKVLVCSRGDDRLLALNGCVAAHFPQGEGGVYAGHHPANSQEAIDRLETLRCRGHDFFLLPRTAFWWLDHYADFQRHLDQHYERIISDNDCVLFRLNSKTPTPAGAAQAPMLTAAELERRRPTPAAEPARLRLAGSPPRQRVLVLGIYLASRPNNAEDIVANLASSSVHEVTQRWVVLGGPPSCPAVAAVTAQSILKRTPKFAILNDLLTRENLAHYDYVVVCDDDILLPTNFLDSFITLQFDLEFALAQPARTSNSYIDHPIVEQQRGVLARRTQFVEIGPVFSVHRSGYDLVFPFDLTASMGWGYENIWAYRLNRRGLKMGIIDALPVDHGLRKPVENYSWAEADRERKALWAKHEHLPLDQCCRVLEVVGFSCVANEKTNEPKAC